MAQLNPIPRPEYPRPLLVRDRWLNLNGTWRFLEDADDEGLRAGWGQSGLPRTAGTIVVPFPVEAAASGVGNVQPANVIWYERMVTVPADWNERIALHIGASDHWTRVFVNGVEVGQHRGGYTPMTFDIAHVAREQEVQIVIRVEDNLSWTQPRGKQAGTTRWPIDYDSVTGIWQTVWLEPLPEAAITGTHVEFQLEGGELQVTTLLSQCVDGTVTVQLQKDGEIVVSNSSETGYRPEVRTTLQVSSPELWSPESPHLYDMTITLTTDRFADQVQSHVGLRQVSVDGGVLQLNGAPLYLRGVLDQGYFEEGWYTPLSDEAIRKDIELTLAMGFNCARKHQKAEDPRYLYWADKLGLMVWAEMPSGKIFSTELVTTLTDEWLQLVQRDRAHPSVVSWVPFNESWGIWHQADRPQQRAFVDGIVRLTQALDSTRPVVGNDGWEYSSGDLWTLHLYQSDDALSQQIGALLTDPSTSVTGEGNGHVRAGALPGANVEGLPILLTECGGVGFGRYGDDDFSYGELPETAAELETAVRATAARVAEAGVLQGFVWTQLTDIQQEINGLLYFDRTPKLPLATYYDIFASIGTEGGSK